MTFTYSLPRSLPVKPISLKKGWKLNSFSGYSLNIQTGNLGVSVLLRQYVLIHIYIYIKTGH